jgi:hypothetical protein
VAERLLAAFARVDTVEIERQRVEVHTRPFYIRNTNVM